MSMNENIVEKYLAGNIDTIESHTCGRSLRYPIKERKGHILRNTYRSIEPYKSPLKISTLGFTIKYLECQNTCHSHNNLEEVYFILKGKEIMQIE
ncbi:MAG: hypothetical protein ABDH32_07360 [Candidatus Caldarchaeales archaeon]